MGSGGRCSGAATGKRPGFACAAVAVLVALSIGLAPGGRARAADGQGGILAPVTGELLAQAASLDLADRLRAVAALQALATPAAWNLLAIMLRRDVDPAVRRAAAQALGTASDPAQLDPLREAERQDPDPEVRAYAGASRRAVAPFGKRVKLAAGLSVLCPGCGYIYLGRWEKTLAYVGGVAGLLGTGIAVTALSPIDPLTGQQAAGRGVPFLAGAQNLWFYGIFATYRDARLARSDAGARYPVAREDLGDLMFASFNPRVLKRPWVWAGVPLALGGAVGVTYLISRVAGVEMSDSMRTLGDPGGVRFFGKQYGTGAGFALGELYNLSLFLPVGVGEEALFRGVVQAGLSETSLGLWGGWALASVIFGGVHLFNFIGMEDAGTISALAVPFVTLSGAYMGLAYVHTGFSLLTSTAIHFWYDFLLSTIAFVADPDNQPFNARFAIPF